MPVGSIVAFWGVAALLIAVPGVDWAFAIGAGLRRQVLPGAAGIVLGYVMLTAVVAAGLGALIAATPVALTALTIAGAAYLIWLGISTLRKPGALSAARTPPVGRLATLGKGIAVSGLNPKGLLIFVAILPQFTDPRGSLPMPVQLACLGFAFVITCAVVYPCVGLGARLLLRAKPMVALVVSRVSGGSMIVVGLILAIEPISGIVHG